MFHMLFTLFAFIFLGIGALVVDHGIMRLTHLQMRNGVESAAMEGIRLETVASRFTTYSGTGCTSTTTAAKSTQCHGMRRFRPRRTPPPVNRVKGRARRRARSAWP